MNLKSLPKKVKNALVTIKDFCIKQLNMANDDSEYCLKCPFYDDELKECYFGIETPDNWEIEEEQKGESK